MNYLAVDGGAAVGYATLVNAQPRFNEKRLDDFTSWADGFLATCITPMTVISERFVITPKTAKTGPAEAHFAIETTGVLRYMCQKYGHRFIEQTAAQAKEFGTDHLLHYLGWWTVGSDHARDAGRHLLRALANEEPKIFAVITAGYLDTV